MGKTQKPPRRPRGPARREEAALRLKSAFVKMPAQLHARRPHERWLVARGRRELLRRNGGPLEARPGPIHD